MPDQIAHSIDWSEEEGCYIGTVPSMPGCTATGETIPETMKELEKAKLEWADESERKKGIRQ